MVMVVSQPRYVFYPNTIISYPNPYGCWKWMFCFRPYRWFLAPKWFYSASHNHLSYCWIFGLRFCCFSFHYQKGWKKSADLRYLDTL